MQQLWSEVVSKCTVSPLDTLKRFAELVEQQNIKEKLLLVDLGRLAD